jgi:hypothetical protein
MVVVVAGVEVVKTLPVAVVITVQAVRFVSFGVQEEHSQQLTQVTYNV